MPTYHRYWRINVTANNGNPYLLIAELQFREISGGADLTDGKTATASSNLPGYEPANAVNNDGHASSWAATGPTGNISVDLVTPAAVTEFVLQVRDSSMDQPPKDFTLQYADSAGGPWTTAGTYVNQTGWGLNESRTFTVPAVDGPVFSAGAGLGDAVAPGAHRYWRANIINTNGNTVTTSIGELEFRETVGGANVATTPANALASSTLAGYSATACFDGVAPSGNNFWKVDEQTGWLGYDFGAGNAKQILEVALTSRVSASNENPMHFRIEYSDDNVTWTISHKEYYQNGWGSAETRLYAHPSTMGAGHKFWRINVSDNNGDVNTLIAELQMRAVSAGADLTHTMNTWASGYIVGYEPSDAFANDGGTTSWAIVGTTGQLAIGFLEKQDIVEFTMQARSSILTQMPQDFTLEYADNPVDGPWTVAASYTGETAWGNDEVRTFGVTPPPPLTEDDAVLEATAFIIINDYNVGTTGSGYYLLMKRRRHFNYLVGG